MKYLGCAYYPEYWGVGRVETDARLMKGAGINIVRIGEFAWTPMENKYASRFQNSECGEVKTF